MQFLTWAATAAALPLVAFAASSTVATTAVSGITSSSASTGGLGATSVSSLTTTATQSSVAPSGTPAPSDAIHSCAKLHSQCEADATSGPSGPFTNVFNKESCVFMFTCYAAYHVAVDDVLASLGPKDSGARAASEPRLSTNIFAHHSSDGKTWTQQNYIDAFYGKLGELGGPYPTSVDVVIESWTLISAWTGFCNTHTIPYQNLADWFQYSSTVVGPAFSC